MLGAVAAYVSPNVENAIATYHKLVPTFPTFIFDHVTIPRIQSPCSTEAQYYRGP